MRSKVFGPVGREVPIIGQGTWNMERDNRRAAIAALKRGLELGMTHVDTAELYGYGEVETLVGEAIRGRRDEVFLVSKVLPGNASRTGTPAACEASLRRLQTDHLDCYLLHWWEGDHPLEALVEAMERLVEQGKIRSWGVSNMDVDELEPLLAIAGPGRIACNQVLYHLRERGIERRLLGWCEANGVALVGYSPFGSGDFPEADSPDGRELAELAVARDLTPRQLALAFLVRRPSLFAIPKSSRVAGAEENAVAGGVSLDEDAQSALDRIFALGEDSGELAML